MTRVKTKMLELRYPTDNEPAYEESLQQLLTLFNKYWDKHNIECVKAIRSSVTAYCTLIPTPPLVKACAVFIIAFLEVCRREGGISDDLYKEMMEAHFEGSEEFLKQTLDKIAEENYVIRRH